MKGILSSGGNHLFLPSSPCSAGIADGCLSTPDVFPELPEISKVYITTISYLELGSKLIVFVSLYSEKQPHAAKSPECMTEQPLPGLLTTAVKALSDSQTPGFSQPGYRIAPSDRARIHPAGTSYSLRQGCIFTRPSPGYPADRRFRAGGWALPCQGRERTGCKFRK